MAEEGMYLRYEQYPESAQRMFDATIAEGIAEQRAKQEQRKALAELTKQAQELEMGYE